MGQKSFLTYPLVLKTRHLSGSLPFAGLGLPGVLNFHAPLSVSKDDYS